MAPDVRDVLNYPERGRNKNLEHIFDDLGVELTPFGEKKIFGVPVLGKGWSSIVIYGIYKKKEVAVKIQRTDSNRISLGREASFLRITNTYRIGPTLYYEGGSFLLLEYITGVPIRKTSAKKEDIVSFLEQCHRLDLLGIDHGQIQGGKHLIIGKKCWIIDFEKAGYRTPRNVSSLISEIFLRETENAYNLRSACTVNKPELIGAVREYKKTHDLTPVLRALHL
jgi:putative serine/threonine protein kinase